MKALAIQPARGQQRASGDILAAVSNLVKRTTSNVQRKTIHIAIAAIIVFFACLGAMCVPGILISGLTALTCAAVAPVDEKGGRA